MTTRPFQVQTMLRTYTKQLTNARRLARFRRILQGDGTGDQVSISREAKRRDLVERVAREIVDNLLVTGSESQVVDEIKAELEQALKTRLTFSYPLLDGELEMQIFRVTPAGPVEVSPEERQAILARLWQIALDKVDRTML